MMSIWVTMCRITVLIATILVIQALCSEDEEMLPRIGIIGAGVSGTSAAYFMRQLFGEKAKIDVFEAERVGGRAAVINIGGQEYEAGASVIHNTNRYMVEFSHMFNKSSNRIDRGTGMIGLYGDSGIIFQTSDWTAVTLAKLVWRYGLDLYTIQEWTKNVLKKFNRIYDFQDKGMAFTTVEDMLRAMDDDCVNMTRYSLKDVLLEAGLSQRFTEEFGMAAMRNNYGQTTSAHGFVGAVSMVGAEPGLWSVRGGNKLIAVNLLRESMANLIEAKVKTVAAIKDELGSGSVSYEVEYEKINSDSEDKMGSREYDILVVAAPIEGTRNKMSFVDFPNSVTSFSQKYHNTVAMFVQGKINRTTFDLNSHGEFPSDMFTVSPDIFFNSIGKQIPVGLKTENSDPVSESADAVWKTFFNKVPTEEEVSRLFESRKDMRLVDWLAYPEYHAGMDLPPFILYDKLYYINAVESAAAAMEMNVIGAKNVALLAYNQWHGSFDKIDELHLPASQKEGERSDL